MTTIKATKDLIHGDGTKSFTKDKEYVTQRNITEKHQLMTADVINDTGEQHTLGTWYKHFKIVKNGH